MTSIFGASEHHLVKTSILKLDPNFINTKSSVSSFKDAILQSNFPDKNKSINFKMLLNKSLSNRKVLALLFLAKIVAADMIHEIPITLLLRPTDESIGVGILCA